MHSFHSCLLNRPDFWLSGAGEARRSLQPCPQAIALLELSPCYRPGKTVQVRHRQVENMPKVIQPVSRIELESEPKRLISGPCSQPL